MPSSPSWDKSLTALWANSVFSNSTRAQTLSVISGCLLEKGLTSAGIGFPGRKIRTSTISPQTLKSSATASIVGLSIGRFNATTVLEGVVSSYSGRASKRRTLKIKRLIKSVHEGKKPLRSEYCGASFVQSWYLKQHISSVHEGKKPFI